MLINNITGPEIIEKNKSKILNKKIGIANSTDFYQISKNGPYYSQDPRIRSFTTNQYMPLDTPPKSSGIWLQDIYKPSLNNYGQHYSSYKDVNTGQIHYYTSSDLSNPLIKPVFSINSQIKKTVFIDPMGSSTPNYNRTPNTIHNRNISDYQYMRDSLEHREDIISKQMESNRYRTDWAMRYNQFIN
jgi:hypothetical protein